MRRWRHWERLAGLHTFVDGLDASPEETIIGPLGQRRRRRDVIDMLRPILNLRVQRSIFCQYAGDDEECSAQQWKDGLCAVRQK